MPRKSSPSRSAARAEFIVPMKALGVTAVPPGEWRCEIKYDGYRAIALINQGKVELWSRAQKPMTADYPAIVAALAKLKCQSAILDGEIVALDEKGRSRFQLLQGRELGGQPANLVYFVFDLLQVDRRKLVNEPIEDRQTALQALVGKRSKAVQVSPWFDVDPEQLLEAARQQRLEGIIAKRRHSLYEVGQRSGAWVKCKILGEQEFVIGGFTPPRNSRAYFGALLIGYYEGDRLLYCGKVGTGFNHRLLAELHAQFLRQPAKSCPFTNLPMDRRSRFGTGMTRGEMSKVTWIKPTLVAQIKFAEWTDDGLLRQPVFLGLREDKSAREVRREAPPVG